jgi:hypothetical protein
MVRAIVNGSRSAGSASCRTHVEESNCTMSPRIPNPTRITRAPKIIENISLSSAAPPLQAPFPSISVRTSITATMLRSSHLRAVRFPLLP